MPSFMVYGFIKTASGMKTGDGCIWVSFSMRSSISWTFSTSCEYILSGCILTFHMEIPGYPTLSNGITLHRLSSGGSGGSGSGLAVAVSMKPPIFSAAPLCISLVMCV